MTKSKAFNPDHDIPNLAGKVILVTGGNNGLGLETVRQLAKHGPAHIFVACRSLPKPRKPSGTCARRPQRRGRRRSRRCS